MTLARAGQIECGICIVCDADGFLYNSCFLFTDTKMRAHLGLVGRHFVLCNEENLMKLLYSGFEQLYSMVKVLLDQILTVFKLQAKDTAEHINNAVDFDH